MIGGGGGGSSSSASSHVLKLVVSATLTRDPSKLMRLELCCPRYIALTDVSRRYTLPAALGQYRLVVPAQHKPLALVGLLHRLGQARSVVFASSLDMTHRCTHGLGGESLQTGVFTVDEGSWLFLPSSFIE
jgi:ATP-dependent RNA helicase DDX51/DBP6